MATTNPFGKKWPLAPAVIDYIADQLGISQQEACVAFLAAQKAEQNPVFGKGRAEQKGGTREILSKSPR
jgi:hypothetical protein